MKLIKPSFEILEQLPGLEGLYKQIELAGRTCYKSEDKITETSAKEFVDRMIKSGHGAMLEHGTVYLSLDMTSREQYFKYCYNKFSKANSTGNAEYSTWRGFVTTNLRVLVENDWLEDLQYICEPTEYHEKRVTVNVVCDRQIQTEIKTHTTLSSTFESTRYCNYNKDKFGNELTFIESDNFPNIEIKHSPAYDNTWEVLMSAYEEAEALADDVFTRLPSGVALVESQSYDFEQGGPAVDWDWAVGE